MFRILNIPFTQVKHAKYVEISLSPDKDLKPDQATRTFRILEGSEARAVKFPTEESQSVDISTINAVLEISFKAVSDRALRVTVNSTMDSLAVVLEAIESLEDM